MSKKTMLFFLSLLLIACDDQNVLVASDADGAIVDEPDADFSTCTLPLPMEANEQIDHLILTELSELEYSNSPTWYEVFNPTTTPIALADYKIKLSDMVESDLPAILLQPKQHAVLFVSNKSVYDYDIVTDQAGFIDINNSYIHLIAMNPEKGEVALINRSTNKMVDYVIYGSKTGVLNPDINQWSGANAPSFKNLQKNISLIRVTPYKDTNTKADWAKSEFTTIGGSNANALCDKDDDLDGIPDCVEDGVDSSNNSDSCEYFNDMPLYQMGARSNQQDFFAEIDIQDDPNLIIYKESLQKSQQAIAGYTGSLKKKLHVDLGIKFKASFDPAEYNLHTGLRHPGGQDLEYTKYIGLLKKNKTLLTNSDTYTNVYDHKLLHQDIRKFFLFRYFVLGDTFHSDKERIECERTLGQTTKFGTAIMLSLSNYSVCVSDNQGFNQNQEQNFKINTLTSTFFHELGHTLGLQHGGFEALNNKPNYISTMNYLYAEGLDQQNVSDGNQFYLKNCSNLHNISYTNMPNSIIDSPSNVVLDYSYGTNIDIDQDNIDESKGLGWSSGTIAGVDFNCNGNKTDAGYSQILADATGNIKDFNDWDMVTQKSRYNVYFNHDGSSSLSVGDQNADSGLSRQHLDEPIQCHFHRKKK